jgi:hypothetical protein
MAPTRRRPHWALWLGIGVVALGLAGATGVYLTRDAGPEGSSPAIAACRDAVRRDLKTPATARFSEDRIVEQTGATHYVHGVVDAQNSFGATLRNRYECIANQDGDRWTVANVSLLDWP